MSIVFIAPHRNMAQTYRQILSAVLGIVGQMETCELRGRKIH